MFAWPIGSFHVFVTPQLCVLARRCGFQSKIASLLSTAQSPPSSGWRRAGVVLRRPASLSPSSLTTQELTTGMKNASDMKQHCLFSSLTEGWSPSVYKAKGDLNLLPLRLIKTKCKSTAAAVPSGEPWVSAVHLQRGGPESYLKLWSQIITESKANAYSSQSYIVQF